MKDGTHDHIATRALAALRAEGPATPPADLAARAAARALAARSPRPWDELVAWVLTMARPAAALGCAAALLLGLATVGGGRVAAPAEGSSSLALVSDDDITAWVLPISVTDAGGTR